MPGSAASDVRLQVARARRSPALAPVILFGSNSWCESFMKKLLLAFLAHHLAACFLYPELDHPPDQGQGDRFIERELD